MPLIFVSGCFNVLHPGHLRLLRFAKECGDRLIVAVQSDRLAADEAHVHEHLRLEGVQSISWVDEAFIFDEPLTDLITRLRPDIIVKGKEHEFRANSELAILEKYGGCYSDIGHLMKVGFDEICEDCNIVLVNDINLIFEFHSSNLS